jgi:hypothetical protein
MLKARIAICTGLVLFTAARLAAAQSPSDASAIAADADRGEDDSGARTLVAVLFLATGGVDMRLADNLTEVLVASVASSGDFAIVGREQFGAAMGVGGEEETLRCAEDPICLGRVGAVMGAEEIVLGSLGERAERYIVNLTRIDVARGRLVHRVFRTTPAELSPLIQAVTEGARGLMAPPLGAVRITVNVDSAALVVDGVAVTPDPDGVLRGLEPGEHLLEVSAEGYGDAEQRFHVDRGETLDLSVTLTQAEVRLVEQETPWYRRWWFWTILGSVVGGGATAAAIALTADQPEPARGTLGTIRFP